MTDNSQDHYIKQLEKRFKNPDQWLKETLLVWIGSIASPLFLLIGLFSLLEHDWMSSHVLAPLIVSPLIALAVWSIRRWHKVEFSALMVFIIAYVGIYSTAFSHEYSTYNGALFFIPVVTFLSFIVLPRGLALTYGAIHLLTLALMHKITPDPIIEGFPTVIRDIYGSVFLTAFIGYIFDISRKKFLSTYAEQKHFMYQSSRLASVGQLAAGISHEINNPLAINLGNLQKAKRELMKDDPDIELIKQAMSKQEHAIERIRSIIEDMRTFSREDKPLPNQFDIHERFNNVAHFLKDTFSQRGISVELNLNASRTIVLGHQGRTDQVIMNLFKNSMDALTKMTEKKITVTTENKEEGIVVYFSDTGQGIESEHLNHIFDPFFTTKEVGKGTGLGLGLTQSIISDMNGEIKVKSTVGKGTTFTITLHSAGTDHIHESA